MRPPSSGLPIVMCGNREDAEDLIQEALLEAFSAFARFTEGTHFDRWVSRIMRNTYIDRVRARTRARIEPLDGAFDHASGEVIERHLVDPLASPDAALMDSTLDGPIQEALQALPPEFRMVVVLADIEELTYEAISQMLHVPIGTVRSRLHRGRAILKQKLRQYVHH
ncbi:MAG: sigma-70 family RNA polymerase sigma factor [Chthonomonadales bacterium]